MNDNKTAIYCRVSTEGQEQEGTSIQTQLEACQKYCAAKGYEVAYKFSEAWSGLALERPKLNELRELVRSEQVDAVVVYSLDRFSRDPVHGVILMQELEKHHVMLEAANEVVDNSEVGKLVFYIKGYAAKLDAERRRDATGRGKKATLTLGRLPQGTGVGIYGYKWDKEAKKRVILQHEAKVVRRMFEMLAQGKACFKIAVELNENSVPSKTGKKWSPRTVTHIVQNPAYCGLTYFGRTHYENGKRKQLPAEQWTALPDATPAIISKELFDQAQATMAKSRELRPGKAQHEYPLSGFAVCGKCGSPLVGHFLRGGYRYYHCRGTYQTATRKPICKERYIKADWLEGEVWNQVKRVLASPEVLLNEVGKLTEAEQSQVASGTLEQDIKDLTRSVKSYAGQERVLMNVLRRKLATPDIVLDELNHMKQERDADQKRLADMIATKESIGKAQDLKENLKELCAKMIPNLDACTYTEKREAYKYLDLKVVATPEGADIKGYVQMSSAVPTYHCTNMGIITCK